MYNDYPMAYETVNNNEIYIIVFSCVLLLIFIIVLVSLSKIYKKANRSAISAWIPIYNILVLLEIANLPKWYLFLLLVPIFNIFILIKIYFSLVTLFRKNKLFSLGLIFLPFIFYPILAFGGSEYIGINLIARSGKTTAVDIPNIINEEDKKHIVHEEEDIRSNNIGISIGGGVYQKDYTSDLLQVDQSQEVVKQAKSQVEDKSNPTVNILNKASFIQPIVNNDSIKDGNVSISENNIDFPELISYIPKSDINNNQVSTYQSEQSNQSELIFPPINDEDNLSIQLSSEDKSFVLCPKCGTKVKKDVKNCFLCGYKIN